jgi:hypothetical protein
MINQSLPSFYGEWTTLPGDTDFPNQGHILNAIVPCVNHSQGVSCDADINLFFYILFP